MEEVGRGPHHVNNNNKENPNYSINELTGLWGVSCTGLLNVETTQTSL